MDVLEASVSEKSGGGCGFRRRRVRAHSDASPTTHSTEHSKPVMMIATTLSVRLWYRSATSSTAAHEKLTGLGHSDTDASAAST